MFEYFRKKRYEKIVREHPIDDELWERTLETHPILAGQSAEERQRLKTLTTLFAAEKQFELVRGFRWDEAQKLSLCVQACLPIRELGFRWFDDWKTLIVSPSGFSDEREQSDGFLAHVDSGELAGEVMEWGPIIFSWKDVEDSGWGDGFNVVVHEIAHKLDGRGSGVDGCPPLHRDMDYAEWKSVFSDAYRDFGDRVKKLGRRADRTLKIDPYASQDPGEFFAVLSEHFFEEPHVLEREYADVYRLMKAFYKQDPLARSEDIRRARKKHDAP